MNMTDQVRRAIQDCGLTQAELARRTGLTRGALSRFMSGERDMTLRTLSLIAEEIGVALVYKRPKRKGR